MSTVNINFQVINTNDPASILIGDQSNWGVAKNKPAYLIITPPGSTQTITLTFGKHKLMPLTSVSLGLSCVSSNCDGQTYEDLDDGVWEFCLQSAFEGLNKKRYYLKDDQLRQEIAKIMVRLVDTQGFSFKRTQSTDDFAIIHNMLDTANYLIMEGRNVDAMKAYNEAVKLVEKYKHCKECI